MDTILPFEIFMLNLCLCVVSHLPWPSVHWGRLNTVVKVSTLHEVPRYNGPAGPDAMSARAAAMRCVTVAPGRPVRRLHDALHHPLGPAANLYCCLHLLNR